MNPAFPPTVKAATVPATRTTAIPSSSLTLRDTTLKAKAVPRDPLMVADKSPTTSLQKLWTFSLLRSKASECRAPASFFELNAWKGASRAVATAMPSTSKATPKAIASDMNNSAKAG